jgi:hypothetical protein
MLRSSRQRPGIAVMYDASSRSIWFDGPDASTLPSCGMSELADMRAVSHCRPERNRAGCLGRC